jgi:hypothetical protein
VPLIHWLSRRWQALVDWFFEPVDARIYACVRISYAATCLVILLRLWPMRLTYLSDAGSMVPAAHVWFSPFSYSRTSGVVTLVMAVAILAALALLVGFARRLSALLLFVWHVSLAADAYMVMSGFDLVMRIVGFVLLLSPLGPALWRWRWASQGGAEPPQPQRAPAYGLRLLQFQTAVVYLATVWLKAPDRYWRNGELMAYFHMSLFARWPSALAADLPRLSVLMTWSTLVIETIVPLLLWRKSTRRWGFLLGALLHGGIALTSIVWVFSLAMIPFYLSFLDEEDLKALRLA